MPLSARKCKAACRARAGGASAGWGPKAMADDLVELEGVRMCCGDAASSATARDAAGPKTDLWAIVFLCVLGVLVYSRGITVGGFRWPDEPVHAMDGVLIHDWGASGPSGWFHPVEFARHRYARFPSLGIGVTYPPGFAVAEAAAFAVLGVSPVTARAAVIPFALTCLVATFMLLRRATAWEGALLGAATLLYMPLVVLWTRQAMLEMPTMAMMVLAAFLFLRYVDRPDVARLLAFLAPAIAAPLFKQPAAFLLLAFFLWGVLARRKAGISWKHFVIATVLVTLTVGVYFGWVFKSGGFSAAVVTKGRPFPVWFSWDNLRDAVAALVRGSGWVCVALAALGAVLGLRRGSRVSLMAAVWLACLISMWAFLFRPHIIEDRYMFWGTLPLGLLGGLAFDWLVGAIPGVRVRTVVVLCLALAGAASGFLEDVPSGPDYAPVVAANADKVRGHIVMFSGQRDADFVFAVRQIIGPDRVLILRSSKVLYHGANAPHTGGFQSFVSDVQDVRSVIEHYAPDALFVERGDLFDGFQPERLLRQYLDETQEYALIGSSKRHWLTGQFRYTPVDVYVRTAPANRTADFVDLPVSMAGTRVRVDLKALGF